jgi:hypothetical protein
MMLATASLEIALFVVLIVGPPLYLAYYCNREYRRLRDAWSRFASANGMTFNGNLRDGVRGRFGDCEMRIVRTGISGPFSFNRWAQNRFTITLAPSTPEDLEIHIKSNLLKPRTPPDKKDITAGDPELDKTFVVRGRDEARIRAIVTDPVVRDSLLEVLTSIHNPRVMSRRLTGVRLALHSRYEGTKPRDRHMTELTVQARLIARLGAAINRVSAELEQGESA